MPMPYQAAYGWLSSKRRLVGADAEPSLAHGISTWPTSRRGCCGLSQPVSLFRGDREANPSRARRRCRLLPGRLLAVDASSSCRYQLDAGRYFLSCPKRRSSSRRKLEYYHAHKQAWKQNNPVGTQNDFYPYHRGEGASEYQAGPNP